MVPTLVTNVSTVDGEVKLDEETRTYTLGGTAVTFGIEPTAAPNTYSSVKLVQTEPDGTETEFVADAGLSEITVDIGTLKNGLYWFHALTVDEFGNLQTKVKSGGYIATKTLCFGRSLRGAKAQLKSYMGTTNACDFL